MDKKNISKQGEAFFVLTVQGSNYEMGRQIGEATAYDIADMWENFTRPRMIEPYGTPEEKYDETYRWLRDNLEKVSPSDAEIINGIAAGSGMDIEKVWMMNHYGVLWSANGLFCTTMALRDSDVGPVLAQNLDIGPEDFYYILTAKPDKGYATLTEAACGLWRASTGVNEKGLAVGSSNLASSGRKAKKPLQPGIPIDLVPKLSLRNCATVPEAVEFVKSLPDVLPVTSGYQLNFIDSNGDMAVVDKTGPYTVVRQCEDGMNFTTNFSLDKKLEKWRMEGTDPAECANLYMRAENIRSSYAKLNGSRPTTKWLKELFRSHEGIGRLCRHGEAEYGYGYSRLGFVCYPCERKIEVTNGLPCCNEYQAFSL